MFKTSRWLGKSIKGLRKRFLCRLGVWNTSYQAGMLGNRFSMAGQGKPITKLPKAVPEDTLSHVGSLVVVLRYTSLDSGALEALGPTRLRNPLSKPRNHGAPGKPSSPSHRLLYFIEANSQIQASLGRYHLRSLHALSLHQPLSGKLLQSCPMPDTQPETHRLTTEPCYHTS